MDFIHRYLNCGDLHFGFARVKCNSRLVISKISIRTYTFWPLTGAFITMALS